MAFADPQTITIGSALSLPRTGSGPGVGDFTTNDGATIIQVRHSYGSRYRRSFAVVVKKYAINPSSPTTNIPVSATIRITVDQPVQGYSVAELLAVLTGMIGNLTATTNTNITKLLGGEN